jgi:N12 class adenine-specific DNA methylase
LADTLLPGGATTKSATDPLFPGQAAPAASPKQRVEAVAKQSGVPVNYMLAAIEASGAKTPEEVGAAADQIAATYGPRIAAGESVKDIVRRDLRENADAFIQRAQQIAAELYPQQWAEKQAKLTAQQGGLGNAAKVGVDTLQQAYGSAVEGIGNVVGSEGMADYGAGVAAVNRGQAQDAARGLQVFDEIGGAGDAGQFVGEQLAQNAPQMGASAAGAMAGAAIGSFVPGVGTGIGALVGGLVVNLPFFYGMNRERQKEEVPEGQEVVVDEAAAALTAIPQAALDTIVDKMLLGMGPTPAFMQSGGIFTRAAKGVVGGAVVEVPTEIGQALLERMQAGLPIADDEAIKEYRDVGIAAGLVGGTVAGVSNAATKPKGQMREVLDATLNGDTVRELPAPNKGGTIFGEGPVTPPRDPTVFERDASTPRTSRGQMGDAAGATPAPLFGVPAGTPLQVTAPDLEGPINGTLSAETPLSVTITTADGEVLEIPRGEIERGDVAIQMSAPTDQTEPQTPPVIQEGQRPVIEEEPATPEPDSLSAKAMAKVKPTKPKVETPPEPADLSPDEARARLSYIEDQARTNGWDTRLRQIHDDLAKVVARFDKADQDAANKASGTITKKDGSPFKTEEQAKRALGNQGFSLDNFEITPQGDGFVAKPRQVAPSDAVEVSKPALESQQPVLPPAEAPQPAPEGKITAAPMAPAETRAQPDMLGGREVPENELAAKEKRRREWGQFLGIAEHGKSDWDGELEGRPVRIRRNKVRVLAGPKPSDADMSLDTIGMSREDIAGWVRDTMRRLPPMPDPEPVSPAVRADSPRGGMDGEKGVASGSEAAPTKPQAPVKRNNPAAGKTYRLDQGLSDRQRKTLAKTRGTEVGDVLAEIDNAVRRAAVELRGKDIDIDALDERGRDANGRFQQMGVMVREGETLARNLLDDIEAQKTNDLAFPNKDEDSGEWEFDGTPLSDALEWLDNQYAMGLGVDEIGDPGPNPKLMGDTTPMPKEDIFPPVKAPVSLDGQADRQGFISQEQADQRIAAWKKVAADIGKTNKNAGKVVISIFDYTGAWAQPWRDAGYTVLQHDIKTGSDLLTDQWIRDRIEEVRAEGFEVYGVLSACPCTTFAGSGARWWQDLHDKEDPEALKKVFGERALSSGAKSAVEYNVMLVNATRDVVELAAPTGFHVLENPIGRIETAASMPQPRARFHPYNFGNPYTKRTQLFGTFQTDLPFANVEPVEGSKMQSKHRGDDPLGKEARSTTPEGFAYAFFMANDPDARELKDDVAEPAPATPTAEEFAAAAAETDPNPTEAQKEAENYKTGKINWNGLTLSIENAKGATRSGTAPDGSTWSVKMPAHYGRILRTEGADGDHVDFYMGPRPDSDLVVVVDQKDAETGVFDEHKVMLGFANRKAALDFYVRGFSDGKGADRMGGHKILTVAEFKDWLETGDLSKPVREKSQEAPRLAGKSTGTPGNLGSDMAQSPRRGNEEGAPSAPENQAAEPEAAEVSVTQKPDADAPAYGATNKLVTADRAAELRDRLKAKLRDQLNSGIDPEILAIGAELAVFHIEAGARRFEAFAHAMAKDLGTTVQALRPYLRAFYNSARDLMEDGGASIDGMDGPDEVRAALATIGETTVSQDALEPAIVPDTPPQEAANDIGTDAGDDGSGARESEGDRGQEAGQAGSGGEGGVEPDKGQPGTERAPRKRSERGPDVAGEDLFGRAGGVDSVSRPRPTNHVIQPGDLEAKGGDKTRAKNSIAAIQLLKQLQREGRPATAEERAKLALYGGAGTLSGALPRSDGSFRFPDLAQSLRDLLSDEEYRTLSRTSQYAFYTSESALRSMWGLAKRLGFRGGRVYEPGMGVGGFPGTIPADLRAATRYTGLELDHVTAQIAAALYPEHTIRQGDFIKTALPRNYYDLVIGNPPFSGTKIQADPEYPQGFLIHDYFFAKSLDAVRPGGLLVFITSAGTMNKMDASARDYLADRADLVGAIRLPNTAFKENGTEVTTDIIALRKRLEGEKESNPGWRSSDITTVPDAEGGTGEAAVNRYFIKHPEMILGEQGLFDTLTGGDRIGVRPRPGSDFKADLEAAVAKFPRDIMSEATPADQLGALDVGTPETKTGSFYIKDGEVYQFDGRTGQKVEQRSRENTKGVPKADMETIRALIPIKMALREVYNADLNERDATEARRRLNEAYDVFVAKRGPINLEVRSIRRPSIVEQEAARQEAFETARASGDNFDIGSFDAGPMLAEGRGLGDIARAREEARAQPGYREGDFDPDAMPDKIVVKRPNIEAFGDDPESFRLRAIERYDSETDTAKKTRVFSESAITKSTAPKIASPEDALLFTLSDIGKVDIDRIATLAGSTPERVREELGDKIFLDPVSKEWKTRANYLSGNVRRKLREAQAAAKTNPSFDINVEALEAILPQPVVASEIRVPIGASWFPPSLYSEWAKSIGLRLDVEHKATLGLWVVDGSKTEAKAKNEFGTEALPFADLMRRVMNGKALKVQYTTKEADGSTKTTVDDEATQAATDKADELRRMFNEWFWSDETRALEMEGLYNEVFNAEVAPRYDGSYLTTPGIHADWSWRPHQTAVVARILQSGSTYMAHTVGAGKTSAMIGAVMEARRLGIWKKPMIVVPNHMLAQFATEFYQQYPLANILVADEKRFHTSTRKQFIADVALGDWDAVIITHSGFGKIPASERAKAAAVEDMLGDIRDVLEDTKTSGDSAGGRGGDMATDRSILGALESIASTLGVDTSAIKEKGTSTRKKIEQLLEAAEQRISRQTSDVGKDQVFDFDEIGVDALLVDEAHLFRKLSFATGKGAIKGIDPAGSVASMDLYVKARALDKQNPGRSLVLASGTPITNTMAEAYTISRYLQPDALQERGVAAFDSWAGTFGEIVSALEQTPDGGYKEVSRFAKFVNTPELSLMMRQVMDVVTGADLEKYVTRPKLRGGKRNLVVVDATPELKAYQADLGQRMTAIQNRKGPVQKGDDIMLSVINDGRLAAIDMRLVDKTSKGYGSKLERMIANAARVWKEGADTPLHGVKPEGGYTDEPVMRGPSTQIIFATLGINGSKHNPDFKIHRFIKSELVRMGVPPGDIILAETLTTHAQKARAFGDMNEGSRRILVGSKSLFTGVNAQRRLKAIHNLDPLWYPADDEQRNGRGIRQGNMNPEIEIFDYSTKGTYDATMWGMMGRKAAFIEGFFRGDPDMREMEDLGEASVFEQAKAMSTSDPRILELTDLKTERDKLERRRNAAKSQRDRLSFDIRSTERQEQRLRDELADLEQLAAKAQDLSGDKFAIKIDGADYSKRPMAGNALLAMAEEMVANADDRIKGQKVGEISGFPITASVSLVDRSLSFSVEVSPNWTETVGFSDDPVGLMRRLEGVVGVVRDSVGRTKSAIDATIRKRNDLTASQANLKGFAEQDKLDEIEARIDEIEAQLIADNAPPAATESEMRNPSGWGEVEADPPFTDKAIREITRDLNDEVRRTGLAGKVSVRVIEGLTNAAGLSVQGVAAGSRIGVSPGSPFGEIGVLRHEIVHVLRNGALWGTEYGLFTAEEWRGLVAEARKDKATVARVKALYGDRPTAVQTEETVAELYRIWAASRDRQGPVAATLRKVMAFFEAVANALRGRGFQSAAMTLEKIARGQVGGRGPDGGAPRDSKGRYVGTWAEGMELRMPDVPYATTKDEFEAKERSVISKLLTDAMGGRSGRYNLLALVPGRALFSELGKAMPGAQRYLRFKEEMDALRSEWHHKTDVVSQEWHGLIAADRKANKAMMDLMHDATRAGVDPSKAFKAPERRKGVLLEEHAERVRKLKEAYSELRPRFKALPAEFQAMFGKVRDTYDQLATAFEDAVINNASKSMRIGVERAERAYADEIQRIKDEGLKGEAKIAAEGAAAKKLAAARRVQGWGRNARLSQLRMQFESNRLDGPYFPLMRFGNYFVTTRDSSGKVVSFSRFESEKKQLAFAAEMRKQNLDVTAGVLADTESLKDQVDPNFVADIEAIIGEEMGDPAVMDMIWQRWLETLPDFSVRRSRIHRKGTPGWDGDAFRAFGRQVFHGGHQLARLTYALDMQKALEDARREAVETSDPNRNGLIVNEMEKRHAYVMNPTGSAAAQALTSAAFIYYLGLTPAAAIVNLSQTTVVGIPMLAGGFDKGGVTRAATALTRAMGDFVKGRGQAGQSPALSAEEKAAMEEAYRRGTIDKSEAHDLAGVAESGVEYSSVRMRVMKPISYLFHHAERLNREVTFLAAYRMGRDNGFGHDDAINKAADLTWKAHLDYQNTSRPRIMQSDTAKVLLVFRNFQIGMIWRLFRDMHQIFNGKSAEDKREARTQLLGITAMMMLHAGVTGTWGYALLMMLAGLFLDGGSDEAEEELKRAVVNTFGPGAGGMLLKGVPGHVLGLDLTNRLGMPELWFRSSDRTLEGEDQYNYWLQQMVGAVPGIFENQWRGIQQIGEGETWRGVETMAPKFVRDLMKAARYGDEGVTTFNGEPLLDEVSPAALIAQALGFTPAKVAEQYETNTRLKNRERRITRERQSILADVTGAMRAGEMVDADLMAEVAEFNRANPDYPITPDTIMRSLRARIRASDQMEGGIRLNPRLDERLREEAAPGVY